MNTLRQKLYDLLAQTSTVTFVRALPSDGETDANFARAVVKAWQAAEERRSIPWIAAIRARIKGRSGSLSAYQEFTVGVWARDEHQAVETAKNAVDGTAVDCVVLPISREDYEDALRSA